MGQTEPGLVAHFLHQGSVVSDAPNWGPSVPEQRPVGTFLIQVTTSVGGGPPVPPYA